MEFSTLQQLENTYMAETFSRFPVAIERGEGATLFDTEGKRYVDFGSGIAVNIFGANDEKWKAAVIDQLSRIQHVSNYYYSEPQLDLAELLCFRTGAKRVFFANSGAEANECALKAARKYSFERYGEGRKKIISLNGSFHGRTLFTLTATGQQAFHRFFGPFVPEVVSVDANMKAVEKESENACAVIIECVQGESGVEALDRGFVRALRTFCDEHDILLICDEVQSGNGRTGKFCAYEHYGITPDIMTTAKVQGKAEYLRAKLKGFDGVKRVTGLGLMIGLEVEKPAKEIAQNCLKRGLLVLTAHEKVRIVPPLNITKTEMDEGLTILREVLAQ